MEGGKFMAKTSAKKAALKAHNNEDIDLTELARRRACESGIVIDRSGWQLDADGRIVGNEPIVPILVGCR